ncbi:MAG: signal peptidase I [Planctomycetes bacterium]|nr:signal peptidase I [Planctomycetota bacterium]
MTATPTPPVPPAAATAAARGPIRNTLESFGMAVLMAILLKYFALEAYVIPTPSMQPTLMGSPKEGESDRILVDKVYYLMHEPERWDIAVFRYPVRQIQSYVKRIVGVGGDRLKIAGGNLYNVSADGKTLTILRKPERLEGTLWREIYPMRRRLAIHERGGDPWAAPSADEVFGNYWNRVSGKWEIDGEGTWIGTPSGSGKLITTAQKLGASNNYSDGYDLTTASLLRKSRAGGRSIEKTDEGHDGVQDLRLGVALRPDKAPAKVVLAIDITSLKRTFELVLAGGKGVLVATDKKSGKVARSEPFDLAVPAGSSTEIGLSRLDDRLAAFHRGRCVQRFDVDAFAIHEHLDVASVVPRIEIHTDGPCRLASVRIERDLHYINSGNPEIIEVPAGHFYMMGDNTLGSADSRDWRAVRIGIDAQGRIVDPEQHKGDASVRVVWGNKRTKPLESADLPHDDDNPVPLRYRDKVVFVDQLGETRGLDAKIDPKQWGRDTNGNGPGGATAPFVQFYNPDGKTTWIAHEEPRSFVPRAHIEGRPIARFLRALPFKLTAWIR